jgi:hypothetical protein
MDSALRFEDASLERRFWADGVTRASGVRGDVAGLIIVTLASSLGFCSQLGEGGAPAVRVSIAIVILVVAAQLAWIRIKPDSYQCWRILINCGHRLRWALVFAIALCSTSGAENGFRPQTYIRTPPGTHRALLAVLFYPATSLAANILHHPLPFLHSLVGALLLLPIFMLRVLPFVVASFQEVYELAPFSQRVCLAVNAAATAPLSWLQLPAVIQQMCRTEHGISMVLALMFVLGMVFALQIVYTQERSARLAFVARSPWPVGQPHFPAQLLPGRIPLWLHLVSSWALALAAWVLLAMWHAVGMQSGAACCGRCPGRPAAGG